MGSGPPKGSIPGRKPSKKLGEGLGDTLEGTGNLLGGLLGKVGKLLGKTVEDIQNLNLEDLEKLVEAKGNEEASQTLRQLNEALGKGVIDLSKLAKIQSGVGGHILGKRFGGGLPLERRGSQETKFDVKGTRSEKTIEQKDRIEKVEIQEPELEVYQEGDYIKVVGEIPGVGENNIKCEVKEEGRVLRISAEGRKKYEKEISLPAQVSQKVNWRYQNGILEITLTKKGEA